MEARGPMQTVAAHLDAVNLEIYRHLFTALAEEMGAALRRAAYSPNVKERRDYSCALFSPSGFVVAQGDHMPVHLGAMPMSVEAALRELGALAPGDVACLNDPFRGGTHLPDITLVAPVYAPPAPSSGTGGADARSLDPAAHGATRSRGGELPGPAARRVGSAERGAEGERTPCGDPVPAEPTLLGYVAARAHHADVGGSSPGSMPLSREIYQEGLVLPPVRLVAGGRRVEDLWRVLLANVRTPEEREGDLDAQLAALHTGQRRLLELAQRRGAAAVLEAMDALVAYADRLLAEGLARIPPGRYEAEDVMDDDGFGHTDIPLRVALEVQPGSLLVDFSGSAPQTEGGINAVAAITASAVRYVVRCVVEELLGESLPAGGGAMRAVRLVLPPGSIVAAEPPAGVAAGNVETSQRITDVLLRAFGRALPDVVPALSQGTMNNITVGGIDPRTGRPFAYYETVGGGMGAGPRGPGLSAVHTHMTNSLNTPVEALEHAYPFRIVEYSIRRGSGGAGRHDGGDGLRRDIMLLADAQVTLLSERRLHAPAGAGGGESGACGENVLIRATGEEVPLPGKTTFHASAGDVVSVRSPGGGGWGAAH